MQLIFFSRGIVGGENRVAAAAQEPSDQFALMQDTFEIRL